MDKIEIEGICLSKQKIISNPNGNILHGIKKTDNSYYGFGEAYISMIKKNKIKGWNKHSDMILNLVVPLGEVLFVVFDNRAKSKTKGKFYKVRLSQNYYKRLTVFPDLWLAFKGFNDKNLILNIASIEHNPDEIEKKDLASINFDWDKL